MKELEKLKEEFNITQELINEIKKKYNFQKGFSNDDFDKFLLENKSILEKAKFLRNQILQIEWELMTPEQQARAKEVEYLVKLKTGQIKKEE